MSTKVSTFLFTKGVIYKQQYNTLIIIWMRAVKESTIFILEVEKVGDRIRLLVFHVSPPVRRRAFGPFGRNSGRGFQKQTIGVTFLRYAVVYAAELTG